MRPSHRALIAAPLSVSYLVIGMGLLIVFNAAVRSEGLMLGTPGPDALPLGQLRVREVVFQGASKGVLGEIGSEGAPVAAIVRVGFELPVEENAATMIFGRCQWLLVYRGEDKS